MATNVGTFVKIKIGTLLMVGETSSSISSVANMIETSSKVTGRKSSFEYGRINRTISVESISTTDASETAYAFKAAFDAQEAGTKAAFEISEYTSAGALVEGALKIAGVALVSDVSQDNPDDDVMTFSLSLQVDEGTTECTITTNPA